MGITAGCINKIVKNQFSSLPKVTKLCLKIPSRKSPNRRCPTTTHQTPCARVPPQNPDRHGQTPKPRPQNGLELKISRDKKNRVPQRSHGPKIRERKPQLLPNTSKKLPGSNPLVGFLAHARAADAFTEQIELTFERNKLPVGKGIARW